MGTFYDFESCKLLKSLHQDFSDPKTVVPQKYAITIDKQMLKWVFWECLNKGASHVRTR